MSFFDLWAQYPVDQDSVRIRIAGDCAQYDNQCAIRLTRAFLKYDLNDPAMIFSIGAYVWKGQTEPICAADGMSHARGAQSLADYLYRYARKPGALFKPRKTYKPASRTKAALERMRRNARQGVADKKGVIFFKDIFSREDDAYGQARGDHIDLWNGTHTRTKNSEYFDQAQEVWFHEFDESKVPKGHRAPAWTVTAGG